MDVLVERRGDVVSLCSSAVARQFGDEPIFLGRFEGRAWYAARARSALELSDGLSFNSARSLFAELPEAELDIVGRALAGVEFEDTHRFCGRCASPTELSLAEPLPAEPTAGEQARRCPAWCFTFHPRITVAPAAPRRRRDDRLDRRAHRSRHSGRATRVPRSMRREDLNA